MIKNIKCCHLLQKIVNYYPKFEIKVKMNIQITIARNGHFKSLYCLYVLPSVDKNHNHSSKFDTEVRFQLQNIFARNWSF